MSVAGRLDTAVVDIGPPADWVKINVQKTVSSLSSYSNIISCICTFLISVKTFLCRKIVLRYML